MDERMWVESGRCSPRRRLGESPTSLVVVALVIAAAWSQPGSNGAAHAQATASAAVVSAPEELAGKRSKIQQRITQLSQPRAEAVESPDRLPGAVKDTAVRSAVEGAAEAAAEGANNAADAARAAAQQAEKAAEAAAAEEAAEDAEQELDLLRSLDLLYVQHLAAIEQRGELEQDKKRLQEQIDALRNFGPDEPRPYSFWLLEDTFDQLSGEEDRQEASEVELLAGRQMLDSAREAFEEAERERRRTSEEHLAAEEGTDEQTLLARQLQLAELASSLSKETVGLRRVEIEVKTLRQELCKLRQSYLKEKIAKIEKDVRFTEQDYQSRLTDLDKSRDDYKRRLRDSERHLQTLEAQRSATVAELEEAGADKALLATVGESYQLARRVGHDEIALTHQRLAEIEQFRHFLSCRYELAGGAAKRDEIAEWSEELDAVRDLLWQTERALSMRMDEIRVDQATLYRRLHMLDDEDSQTRMWLGFQSQQLQRLTDACELGFVQLKSGRRGLRRLAAELEATTETEPGPRWIDQARQTADMFWNYEIATVDDRPITVSKIISGLFFLLLSVGGAKLVSRMIGGQVLPRLGLNEGATHAVQAILFYSLCTVFGLLSLELVNLPFAAFTFLGGAVAIGLGFGSQNILNNFISGLILLAEQPIRVGDLVEIEGACGMVEEIGARSTRIKTASNHEIIVPNSKLLENKVVNLTLSNNLVQSAIGVTLNSRLAIDDVRRLLGEAASSHVSVLAEPRPIVLFKEFNAATMAFELHFWMKLRTVMEGRVVESDVRETIHRLFRDMDAATVAVATLTTEGKAPLKKSA